MAKQQIPQRFPGLPLPFLYAPKDPRAPPQCLAETPGVVLTSWRGIGERASPSKTQWPKYWNTQQSIFLNMNVHIYSRYKLVIECIETIRNNVYIYIYMKVSKNGGTPSYYMLLSIYKRIFHEINHRSSPPGRSIHRLGWELYRRLNFP